VLEHHVDRAAIGGNPDHGPAGDFHIALARLLEDCDTLRFVGASSGIDPAELAQRARKNAAEIASEKLTTPS
jgi:hypothetical protein